MAGEAKTAKAEAAAGKHAEEEEKQETGERETEEPKEDVRQASGSAFEGIYDRMPDISIRALDCFIALCVIALIGVILVGVLRANHVF